MAEMPLSPAASRWLCAQTPGQMRIWLFDGSEPGRRQEWLEKIVAALLLGGGAQLLLPRARLPQAPIWACISSGRPRRRGRLRDAIIMTCLSSAGLAALHRTARRAPLRGVARYHLLAVGLNGTTTMGHHWRRPSTRASAQILKLLSRERGACTITGIS